MLEDIEIVNISLEVSSNAENIAKTLEIYD